MEPIEVLAEGGWNSINGVFSNEEADFMVQLLGNYSYSNEQNGYPSLMGNMSSTCFPNHEVTTNSSSYNEGSYFCSDIVNSDSQSFSQEGYYSNDNGDNMYVQTSSHESYYLNNYCNSIMNTNGSLSMDNYLMVDDENIGSSTKVFLNNVMEETNTFLNEEMSNENLRESPIMETHHFGLHDQKFEHKRKSPETPEQDSPMEEKHNIDMIESPKKKTRVSGDVTKTKRKQSKKNQKRSPITSNDDEEKQSSSSSNSLDDDSNNSQEQNEEPNSSSKQTVNSNGKTRASRGSATDPQSLYARKRRERINERLRVLQNLVPNGTKVDISTMLEEAVEYVKFLQLQIKLLSSDDLWMYAPIAYNGMNIGALDMMKLPSMQ